MYHFILFFCDFIVCRNKILENVNIYYLLKERHQDFWTNSLKMQLHLFTLEDI